MYRIYITAITGGKPGAYRDPVTNKPKTFATFNDAMNFVADNERAFAQFVFDVQYKYVKGAK
jgi:hypothetical protein